MIDVWNFILSRCRCQSLNHTSPWLHISLQYTSFVFVSISLSYQRTVNIELCVYITLLVHHGIFYWEIVHNEEDYENRLTDTLPYRECELLNWYQSECISETEQKHFSLLRFQFHDADGEECRSVQISGC